MDQDEYIARLGSDFYGCWEHWCSLPKTGHVPRVQDYLDNADPKLQPYVVMMDFIPPGQIRVRLAGTAIAKVIGEITNSEGGDIYSPEAEKQAYKQATIAGNHPCGYVIQRLYKTVKGERDTGYALILPLLTTPDRVTMLGFNEIPSFNGLRLEDDNIKVMTAFDNLVWLDIGAGTPV